MKHNSLAAQAASLTWAELGVVGSEEELRTALAHFLDALADKAKAGPFQDRLRTLAGDLK